MPKKRKKYSPRIHNDVEIPHWWTKDKDALNRYLAPGNKAKHIARFAENLPGTLFGLLYTAPALLRNRADLKVTPGLGLNVQYKNWKDYSKKYPHSGAVAVAGNVTASPGRMPATTHRHENEHIEQSARSLGLNVRSKVHWAQAARKARKRGIPLQGAPIKDRKGRWADALHAYSKSEQEAMDAEGHNLPPLNAKWIRVPVRHEDGTVSWRIRPIRKVFPRSKKLIDYDRFGGLAFERDPYADGYWEEKP